MIRIYGLKPSDKERKEAIKDLVYNWSPVNQNIRVVAEYSRKGNLKGVSIYPTGSKSLQAYIDFNQQIVTTYKRGRVIARIKYEPLESIEWSIREDEYYEI